MVFFSSDTHYEHAAIIKYLPRPFTHVQEMNDELVRRFNERVQPSDTCYFLGDFAFGPASNLKLFKDKLNGHIVFIRGNHDRSKTKILEAGFPEVYNELKLEIDGHKLYLRHRPPYTDEWKKHSEIFLCGHVHTDFRRIDNIINVGVDVHDFYPQTLTDLLKINPSTKP